MERLERFYKIDQLLKDRKVVSFATFKEVLGMSRASVKLHLEYMRSRFNAPIEYDRELNGYRFGKTRSGWLRSVTESGRRGALRAGGSLDEIVENVALHALDLQPVAGAELGPFLRPCALAEVLEQALELRYALPRDGKFLIVVDHATSNMPRFFAAPLTRGEASAPYASGGLRFRASARGTPSALATRPRPGSPQACL